MHETGKFADRRNNIAHGVVVEPYNDGYYLIPPTYSAKKHRLHPVPASEWESAAYAFTADDILHYQRHFDRLYGELFSYVEALVDWPRVRSSL
jgi:hypothetical protein